MPATVNPLDKLIQRAGSLYSLPMVAMEVVRLTGQAEVDTQTIKKTIEGDPALTVKILRVVNSSMFGLSSEVTNLTQALALLGVEPLKLLVLGFSLPDRMFADLAGEHLRRYWTASLTRAVAARGIAHSWFGDRRPSGEKRRVSGDDAFVVGLLRDIGQLVLIQELGEPYVNFLRQIAEKQADAPVDIRPLERQSLGFDHVELSAALLAEWKLPAAFVDALKCEGGKPTDLAEVLRLADLLTQLVADRRLAVLPELMEQGEASCGLNKAMLHELVAPLSEQVKGVADALRAPLDVGQEYSDVLLAAHSQMALAAEQIVRPIEGEAFDDQQLSDDALCEELLAESHELRVAMRGFMRGNARSRRTRAEGPHPPKGQASPVEMSGEARQRLEDSAARLAERCRAERLDLSIALVALGERAADPRLDAAYQAAYEAANEAVGSATVHRLRLSKRLVALLMPGVERRDAVAYCKRLIDLVADSDAVRAGVASIVAVPSRFDPQKLITGATGCLLAAHTVSGHGVKSIEVY